jgi:hypothetical protein
MTQSLFRLILRLPRLLAALVIRKINHDSRTSAPGSECH